MPALVDQSFSTILALVAPVFNQSLSLDQVELLMMVIAERIDACIPDHDGPVDMTLIDPLGVIFFKLAKLTRGVSSEVRTHLLTRHDVPAMLAML